MFWKWKKRQICSLKSGNKSFYYAIFGAVSWNSWKHNNVNAEHFETVN